MLIIGICSAIVGIYTYSYVYDILTFSKLRAGNVCVCAGVCVCVSVCVLLKYAFVTVYVYVHVL
jgi:hypothetical protein